MKWSHSVLSDSLQPHGLQPTRLLHPWDSPGRNTGVGCHFLLQEIFPTQGSNLGLPYCRQTLYHLSHQEVLVDITITETESWKRLLNVEGRYISCICHVNVLVRGQQNPVLNQLIWWWNLKNSMICSLQARDPGKPATGYERSESQGADSVGSSLSLKVWEPAATRAKNWCQLHCLVREPILPPLFVLFCSPGIRWHRTPAPPPQTERQQFVLVNLPI